jgi:hypothetical protein
MQNQENAHSDATKKSLKSLFQKINEFSDSESAQNFHLSFSHRLIYVYNNINNTDFGLNDFLVITYFWPQK